MPKNSFYSGFKFSGLPPSLPLMSPFGLPLAGYPASARWHVFRFPVSSFFPFGSPPPNKTQTKNNIPMVFNR